MGDLGWSDVRAWRLERHHLSQPALATALIDVAGRVCGIHAQVLTAAELSLGLRVEGADRSSVQSELWERKRLVKTPAIRSTIHLLPAAEAPLWLAAVRAAGDRRRNPAWLAAMGLDEARRDAIYDAFREALDGRRLTLAELGEAVEARLGTWVGEHAAPAFGGSWPRWRVALGGAAIDGLVCFGPNEGRAVTFVRPEQWLAKWPSPPPEEEALREACRRYLAAYGPARPAEFARWFNLAPGRAGRLFKELDGELEAVSVEGERRWLRSSDLDSLMDSAGRRSGSVHLLPHFDCYLVGSHPRHRIFPAEWTARGIPIGGGGNVPALVVDGLVAGFWELRRQAGRGLLTVDAFAGLDGRQRRRLEAAAQRVGEIAQLEVKLTLGRLTARPHA